ncbi:MAG: V-type ATPase subunit [Thermoprotei archaeon]
MSLSPKIGTLKRGIPRMEYAPLSAKVAWLRSTLMSDEQLATLSQGDLPTCIASLSNTEYGKWCAGISQNSRPRQVYDLIKNCIIACEKLVVRYAPGASKKYLEAYMLHWDAEEIKANILYSYREGYASLQGFIEKLGPPWNELNKRLDETQKAGDAVLLTAATDEIYLKELISAYNKLRSCERGQLAKFVETQYSWFFYKANLLNQNYSTSFEYSIRPKILQMNFQDLLKGLQFNEAVNKGDETVTRSLHKWAESQRHNDQFSPAPAQAAFYLKEEEGKKLGEIIISKLLRLKLAGTT